MSEGTQTTCRVNVNGTTVEEILDWDYSDDVMSIAEECHFTVDNKARKYRDLLRIGDKVEFILQNPSVNGGAPTVKHRGRIVRRHPKYNPRDGSTIGITSADLGWHLQNCDAPLWLSLQNKTYADVCDPATSGFFDESWGFTGVRFDGNIRRSLKQGVAVVALQAQKALDVVHVIQIEPGDKVFDKIVEYSKRINLLVNVSPDGQLCCFLPDYSQAPLYYIRNVDGDESNNVLDCEAEEDAKTRWTEVTVVGEQVGWDGPKDPQNPNASKKRGNVRHPGNLPFLHRHTVADGEMYQNGLAQKHAEWIYKRGRFDAWWVKYTVADHHQNGHWWVADTMVYVVDDELGLAGNYYVQSVRCRGSKTGGDTTEVVIRLPGVLSASLGVIADPTFRTPPSESTTGTPQAAP